MNLNVLELHGIDTKKGLTACMNDEEFYCKMLNMFLNSEVFSHIEEAFAAENYREMFEQSHNFKGMAGNMGMSALYSDVSALVEVLRKENPDSSKTSELFLKVKTAYENTCEGICAAQRTE